ncbi:MULTISPECIES: DMT family transporter [Dyella]|uniref:DMT family transporter n=2 Tax=Dyella TaxID=231454 RepID=A0A4R0YI81_9GAMM|nr:MULTISPECIES: DMT family transporter [Dyella]TBR36767.1 DMT family transporter [Dyella terrae]TCI08142.1 DMT family transporter [Dyella soli]
MKTSDIGNLLALGALWGGSFLFMRMGAGEFGGMALAGMRALVAGVCFVPLFASAARRTEMRQHWRAITVVGITNSALPFVLFAYAALVLPAGLSAIFDAITPLLVAGSGWLWLKERLSRSQLAGLLLGFAGVLWLIGDNVHIEGSMQSVLACLACVGATVCYAFSVHYSRRRLAAVSPLASAAGSQIVAAIVLLPLTVAAWPATSPGASAWGAMLGLGVACTAIAYVMFFQLIARVGAARTMTVLYLIPAFGVLWGWLFLGETFSAAMGLGCIVILAGTALISRPARIGNRNGVQVEPSM